MSTLQGINCYACYLVGLLVITQELHKTGRRAAQKRSKIGGGCLILGEQQYFCLGRRFSKCKLTRYAKNCVGDHGPPPKPMEPPVDRPCYEVSNFLGRHVICNFATFILSLSYPGGMHDRLWRRYLYREVVAHSLLLPRLARGAFAANNGLVRAARALPGAEENAAKGLNKARHWPEPHRQAAAGRRRLNLGHVLVSGDGRIWDQRRCHLTRRAAFPLQRKFRPAAYYLDRR